MRACDASRSAIRVTSFGFQQRTRDVDTGPRANASSPGDGPTVCGARVFPDDQCRVVVHRHETICAISQDIRATAVPAGQESNHGRQLCPWSGLTRRAGCGIRNKGSGTAGLQHARALDAVLATLSIDVRSLRAAAPDLNTGNDAHGAGGAHRCSPAGSCGSRSAGSRSRTGGSRWRPAAGPGSARRPPAAPGCSGSQRNWAAAQPRPPVSRSGVFALTMRGEPWWICRWTRTCR